MKTVRSFISITIIVYFCTFPSQAFSSKIVWNAGQITFWNQTTLAGDLSYNWLAEMIVVRQTDGRVSAFSADQVYQFGWFDFKQHKYRSFKSLNTFADNDRMGYGFFEIYINGSLTVIRHLKRTHGLFKRIFGHPANFSDTPSLAENPDHFDYYVQETGHHLLALDRFYTDIYSPLMIDYDRQLQTYIKKHNINYRSLLGRLVLISHYNFLVQQDAGKVYVRHYGHTSN